MGLKGFFKKKNKADEPQAQVSNTLVKKKRTKDMLSSVLRETVMETVLEQMRNNEDFHAMDSDGNIVYMGLMLDTDVIGGLNKASQKNNEDKGQIINLMDRSDGISTLITEELLANDSLIIIPTPKTLELVSEFNLLSNPDVPYMWAQCKEDGSVKVTNWRTNMPAVFDVSDGLVDLSDELMSASERGKEDMAALGLEVPQEEALLQEISDFRQEVNNLENVEDDINQEPITGDLGDIFGHDQEEMSDEDLENYANPQVGEDLDSDDDIDFDFKFGDEQSTTFDMPLVNEDEPEEEEEEDYNNLGSNFDFDDFGYEETSYEIIKDDVDADELAKAMRGRFFKDNLDIEIDFTSFDWLFGKGAELSLFDESSDGTWAGNEVARLAKLANTDMAKLHNENLFNMRDTFTKIINAHMETTSQKFSYSHTGGTYMMALQGLKDTFENKRENREDSISSMKNEIRDSFEKQVREAGDIARAEAEARYRERFRTAHQNELSQVVSRFEQNIEEEEAISRKELNEKRRADANHYFQTGVNRSLQVLSDLYKQSLSDERDLFEYYSNKLEKFAEDNRENDIIQARIKKEELESGKRVQALEQEHKRLLEGVQSAAKLREDELEAKMKQLEASYKSDLVTVESNWKAKLAQAEAVRDSALTETNSLRDRVSEISKSKDLEAERMLQGYKMENERLRDNITDKNRELDRRDKDIDRAGKQNALVGILIAIIFLMGGIIFGTFFGSKFMGTEASTSDIVITEEVGDMEGFELG